MNSRMCITVRPCLFNLCKKYRNKTSLKWRNSSTNSTNQLVTKKLDTPEFHKIFTQGMKTLLNIFEKNNYELRIVGDPVCDLLMHKQPPVIDLASIATPDQMKTMLTREKITTLKTKGETHGNISLQVDEQTFKVSTLRTDVVTAGINFTTDWFLDARRRDLTVGAMFLGFDGTVYDYFNGIEDVERRRVRFVGDPAARIKEDYFRIMRYFRYYAAIARDVKNLDSEVLHAVKENLMGLNEISGNKIWSELTKILCCNFKFDLLDKMLEIGFAPVLGLPRDLNLNEFHALHKRASQIQLNPITIMASLTKNSDDMTAFAQRMKLTKLEKELGLFIINHRHDETIGDPLQSFKKILILSTENQSKLRSSIEQVLSYNGDVKSLTEIKKWEMPKFPVKNQQLLDLGVKKGSNLQMVITAMKKRWLESCFALTGDDLLVKFDEIIREIETAKSQRPKTRVK